MRVQRENLAGAIAFAFFGLFPWLGYAAPGDENWDAQFGDPGADLQVSVVLASGPTAFFGGGFSQMGGVGAASVAKWDGGKWAPLGAGIGGFVGSMATAQGKLYVAGYIYSAGGAPARNIACWDGTNWSDVRGGLNDVVFDLASDGTNIYAGGHFTEAGGMSASKIARWDGTNWFPLGSGIIPVNFGGTVVGAVDSVTVGGGSVYVGGRFRIAGGIAATNVARWDGTNWYSLGEGLRYVNGGTAENGAVRSLLFYNGALFAGGSFWVAGTAAANNIARWNGTSWSPVGTGVGASGSVQAMVPNGRDLYVGGSFLNMEGQFVRTIAKWDGTNWSALGSGLFGGSPLGLASTGSELFVGGDFTGAGDKSASRIAMYHIPHALNVQRAQGNLVLSWPATGANFLLEASAELGQTDWQVAPETPVIVGSRCVVTNALGTANQFFRLRRK